ncbi:MAG: L-rhamnose mutarotase [Porphyromonadaceae bacterium]|jgi:hypothetical protein|nr:L-rhamnose mutarotase [Porphyromonadaceae bacterium]
MKISKYLGILITVLLFISCRSEKQHTAVIEIIDLQSFISNDSFLEFAKSNHIDSASLFNRQNRWVIYTNRKRVDNLLMNIHSAFPNQKINVFPEPFYNFNGAEYCKKKPAEEWSHVIMTANLVENPIMQQEYLDYHKFQFSKWREVPEGFCNADFQQVLVFRNGRQLMLVISIPNGKTLAELNPKTTENNPRVDEWNSIMSRYQEGIEGAEEGEVWTSYLNLTSNQ